MLRAIHSLRIRSAAAIPVSVFPALLASLLAAAVTAAAPTPPPGAAEPASPEEWYGAGVRPTEARTPEEERAGFHLPPGFEIRLFAAEPEIKKPMNVAFDSAGRLWVTDTLEYPYPAPEGQPGRDSVRVLEDSDGDGRADTVTTFAEGLNIPIGILPYGEGCICYSIPNLWYLRDTDGDGKCDRRDRLVGPFDTSRDTHGMVNSLRAGADGWIYACHGFNNESRVAGADGEAITLVSGNTFRFRPDGSRVEHVTWGQVNPFGMTQDEWGYYYSADCHSKPISQLIRGGYYPSFGRPDDGLGFIPPMMEHLHGSTAIAGLAYFPSEQGIEPLAGQMLSGNVMTSRINRNRLNRRGATVQGEAMPDFLTSDDPWFRPVDIRLGPDGHIYVADFYNRIIGHYEVPLEHPQRDRHRGRIWQIRRSGAASEPVSRLEVDSLASTGLGVALREHLGDPNPERRNLALQEVAGSTQRAVRQAVKELATDHSAPPAARVAALWCLHRWNAVTDSLARRFAGDPAPQVRTHLFRMLGESVGAADESQAAVPRLSVLELSTAALQDSDANVARAAAETLGRASSPDHLRPLLDRLLATDPADSILRQTLRIAIRDTLANSPAGAGFLQRWNVDRESTGLTAALAQISLALDSEAAGGFLVGYLRSGGADEHTVTPLTRHAAGIVSDEQLASLVEFAAQWAEHGSADELELLDQIAAARRSRVGRYGEPIRRWAQTIAERELAAIRQELMRSEAASNAPQPVQWHTASGVLWPQEDRRTLKGAPVTLTSSFPLGESVTDTLLSEVFAAPRSVEFWLAGHNGHPDQDAHNRNRVELVSAETGLVLHSVHPPSRDQVERIRWDCRAFAGRPVQLRCTDGDSGTAFAWLALGGFEPEWLNPLGATSPLEHCLRLIVDYRLESLRDSLVALARNESLALAQRGAAAEAIARLADQPRLAALLSIAGEGTAEPALTAAWIEAAITGQPVHYEEQLARLSSSLSTADQQRLAKRFVSGRETAALLVAAIEAGHLSPGVLLDKSVESAIDAVGDDRMRAQVQVLRSRATALNAAGSEAVTRFLEEALVHLDSGALDLEHGRAVFTKQCAVCHQIAGEGQVIGPQLDGVGSRGPQRLLEDILTPDLNVDQAFRTTTLLTVDGAVLTGLVRNSDDSQLTIAGSDGKLTSIPLGDIDVRRDGTNSLMPSNFHETLTTKELAALVAYLQQHAGQK